MKTFSKLVGLHALAAVCLLQACAQEVPDSPSGSATESEAPERAIVNITGDLYRAQDAGHFHCVSGDARGIILADPIRSRFCHMASSGSGWPIRGAGALRAL